MRNSCWDDLFSSINMQLMLAIKDETQTWERERSGEAGMKHTGEAHEQAVSPLMHQTAVVNCRYKSRCNMCTHRLSSLWPWCQWWSATSIHTNITRMFSSGDTKRSGSCWQSESARQTQETVKEDTCVSSGCPRCCVWTPGSIRFSGEALGPGRGLRVENFNGILLDQHTFALFLLYKLTLRS